MGSDEEAVGTSSHVGGGGVMVLREGGYREGGWARGRSGVRAATGLVARVLVLKWSLLPSVKSPVVWDFLDSEEGRNPGLTLYSASLQPF